MIKLTIKEQRSFMTFTSIVHVYLNVLSSSLTVGQIKLECLSLVSIFKASQYLRADAMAFTMIKLIIKEQRSFITFTRIVNVHLKLFVFFSDDGAN